MERVEEGGGEGELALRWGRHVRGVSGERSGIAGSSTVEAIAIGEWHARRLCWWSRMHMWKWLDGYVWYRVLKAGMVSAWERVGTSTAKWDGCVS